MTRCLSLFIFISQASLGSSAVAYMNFNYTSDLRYGAARLGDPWVAPTLTSCVVTCRIAYTNCFSVVYNEYTRLCTPGGKLEYNVSKPSILGGDQFYYTDYCNAAKGYRLYVYKSVVHCFYVATHHAIYTEARGNCTALGGRVMQTKTRDKLDLFFYFAKTYYYHQFTFLGLTDLATEGKFFWEDGEPIDLAWKQKIFMPGEPNGETPEVDCSICSDYSGYTAVFDGRCDWLPPYPHYYICELIDV